MANKALQEVHAIQLPHIQHAIFQCAIQYRHIVFTKYIDVPNVINTLKHKFNYLLLNHQMLNSPPIFRQLPRTDEKFVVHFERGTLFPHTLY